MNKLEIGTEFIIEINIDALKKIKFGGNKK